jgi:hypothetical protein
MKTISLSKRLFALAFASALPFCAVMPLAAQNALTGSISGTVTDATGAVVPKATVVITDTDTGAVHTITTGGDGSYVATFLQSGNYEVVLGGGAFGKVDRKNLQLTVGTTLTVDAALPAASVKSEVVVTSESPLLDTERVESSQTITQSYVSNLPVNGRRWDNFVLLTPNVAPDSNSGIVSYRGISGLYNSNLVDGVSNQQALFAEARGRASGAPYVFSQDSIKEFQSAVSGYSAEFGNAAGGQINAITKSGSNALHGDLFYYLRYPALNALDPYSKWQALHAGGNPTLLTQTVHQQQQFGGSVGGPIIKDKLFYFFTYDGFRKVNPILYTSSTSAAAVLAYPTTAGGCPSPLTVAQCTTAAQFLVAQVGSYPRNVKQDIFFPKLDYQLNGKNHVSTSFLWQDFHQPNGYNTTVVQNNGSVQNNGTANFHERFYVANWESVLGNSTANALHFQWSRDLETDTANAPGPNVSIGSGSAIAQYGDSIAIPREAEPDEHRWEIFDTISQTRGRHTLKAGVDLNFIHEIMINLFQGNGNYTYNASGASNVTNFANWVQDVYAVNGGQHYTSFTQVVDTITGLGKDDFWNKNLSAFVEDNWKIRPNFNIVAGLRWDTQLVPQPPQPYTTTPGGVADPFGAAVTTTIHTNYKMIQPRIGFAYNPYPTTVVRGGYGLFFGLIPLSAYYNVRVENGVFQRQYNLNPSASGVYPTGAPSSLNVLFTPPGPPLAAPFAGAHTPTAIGLTGITAAVSPHGLDPNYTEPYTHSADLSVEQQLTSHTTITLGWVGTRGMRLPYSIDLNQPAWTGATRTYDVVNAAGATTSTVTVPFYPAVAATGKPSPNDGNFQVSYSGLNTWYNAMAVSVKQQMSHGFQALFNYTWAHTEDPGQTTNGGGPANTGGGAFFGTDVILDPFNRKELYGNKAINMSREQGRSDIDMRGRFVGSLVYTTTFPVTNHFEGYAVNGWTIAGSATEQTGFPITAFMSSNPPSGVYTTGAGAAASAAGQDGGATGGSDNTNNGPTSAYGRAPFLARNGFAGPGVHNVDLRISREFPIFEKYRFQILGEAFNLVNHRNGLSVATTAYAYTAPGAATCPTGAHTNTCIAPYTATTTTTTPFGTINSTSSILYGARQLQVAAKFFF